MLSQAQQELVLAGPDDQGSSQWSCHITLQMLGCFHHFETENSNSLPACSLVKEKERIYRSPPKRGTRHTDPTELGRQAPDIKKGFGPSNYSRKDQTELRGKILYFLFNFLG